MDIQLLQVLQLRQQLHSTVAADIATAAPLQTHAQTLVLELVVEVHIHSLGVETVVPIPFK